LVSNQIFRFSKIKKELKKKKGGSNFLPNIFLIKPFKCLPMILQFPRAALNLITTLGRYAGVAPPQFYMFPRSHGSISFVPNGKEARK
jgi:hypothetical protein